MNPLLYGAYSTLYSLVYIYDSAASKEHNILHLSLGMMEQRVSSSLLGFGNASRTNLPRRYSDSSLLRT